MKNILILIGAIFWSSISSAKPYEIEELEFKQSKLMDIIRVLAEESKTNIIATPEAGEKEVNIFLKRVTLEEAIKAICRINKLWYRQDKEAGGTFRIMTLEQYRKDLVIGQDDSIRVFTLRNPNVTAVATAIEDLYGNRVSVSYGSGISSGSSGQSSSGKSSSKQFGGRNNRSNNRSSRRNGNSASQSTMFNDATVEQLETLSKDSKQINSKQLYSVLGKNTQIFVTVNLEHNLLIVKTSNEGILKSIAQLVEQLDRPQTQVMLEMKIIEIKVGEDFSSLFNFELTNTGVTGQSTNPIILGGGAALSGGGSLVYEFISKNIKANIELLEQNNRVNVISKPMIVASNHRPASLFVGEERIMVRGYSIDILDNQISSRTITTADTELKEIGTTLEITPHINNDGTMHLFFKEESATLNIGAAKIPISNNSGTVTELPIDTISTARIEGEIFAKHGYTIAVGGLIRNSFSRNRRKVPYFSDIPVLGDIFRSTQDEESRSELVLLITPYILSHEEKKQNLDPTVEYHKYAPNAAYQSKAVPKLQETMDIPFCGEYCAPSNLRRSDL